MKWWNDVVAAFYNGNLLMAMLWLCSVVAAATILDRALGLRRRRVLGRLPGLLSKVSGADDLARVREAAAKDRSLLARVVRVIFESGANEDLARGEGRAVVDRLEKRLVVLEIIGVVSPLLGLLGTVLGMNNVFFTMSGRGLGDFRAFSQGIGLALHTTIIGLCVAIPAYVAHLLFERRVDALGAEIEYQATQCLEACRRHMPTLSEGAEHAVRTDAQAPLADA